jgi:hypothetical protein
MTRKNTKKISSLATTENSSSDEPLLIDADTKASSLESIRNAYHALSFLNELISKDTATVGVRHNTLGLVRAELGNLEKSLGAKDDFQQEEELKKNLLRQANFEIHRLRDEMGKGVTVESIGNKLYQLDKTIYNWWQNLGFSYSKGTLQPNHKGATFHREFTLNIESHVFSHTTKPVTAKARIDAKVKALGSELEIFNEDNELCVLDNPNNREWIKNKFIERFPNCRIWKWESISIRNSDLFQIRHVEVMIDMIDVGDVFEENEKYV